MKIRDATIEDAEVIVEFNRSLAVDSGDDVPRRETLAKGVRRAFEHPELCRYFLAEDLSILGQCMITYEWSDWRDGTLWWLQSVYVRPEHRRRGVFTALYDHVRNLAVADADARGIRLYALTSNERARRAYESCGMTASDYRVFEDSLAR